MFRDGLPQIVIHVPQEYIKRTEKSKELILVEESHYYILAFFNVLMMVTNEDINSDVDMKHGIQTLGLLGVRFTEIAMENLEYAEKEFKKNA